MSVYRTIGPLVIFCFTNFFRNKLGLEDEIKKKNHSDHFPIELKLKETQFCVSFDFNSVGKWSELFLFLF